MPSNKDHGRWQSTQDYAMDADKLDSNGKCLVLWYHTGIYAFDQQPSAHIASLEDVTSIKMTQDGIYILVATDEEVRCFTTTDGLLSKAFGARRILPVMNVRSRKT